MRCERSVRKKKNYHTSPHSKADPVELPGTHFYADFFYLIRFYLVQMLMCPQWAAQGGEMGG